MGDKSIIDIDPLDGSVTTHEYDEDSGATLLHSETNVGDVIEYSKALATDGTGGWSPDRTMRLKAVIPPAVAEMWQILYGIDFYNKNHKPAIRRLLASNEWKHLVIPAR